MNEIVTFQLINAYCKPLLTHACECVEFSRSDLSQLDGGKYLNLMTKIALLIVTLILGTYQSLWMSIQEK